MSKKMGINITIADIMLLLLEKGSTLKPPVIKAPYNFTRLGLAEIIEVAPSHISRSALQLIENGEIDCEKGNVEGLKRRVSAYFLTPNGVRKKNELISKINSKEVIYQGKDGNPKKLMMSDVDHYFGKETSIFEKIVSVENGNVISYKSLDRINKRTKKFGIKKYVNFTFELPINNYFFGREEEMKTLRSWIDTKKTNLIVIYGLAGIGKTSLATELVFEYNIKTNTFWGNINEWSRLRDLFQPLSEFLFKLGKKSFKNYLISHQKIRINEVNQILGEDLKEIKAVFVFDDCHQANKNILMFLSILKKIVEKCPNITVLLLSRNELPFYDLRDVLSKKVVREMHLGDLDKKSSIEFLMTKNIKKSTSREIYKIVKGYPLALNFIYTPKNTNLKPNFVLEDTIKFLYSQVIVKLKNSEKKILKAGSVHRKPVIEKALLYEEAIKFENLENLVKRSILNRSINEEYTMHHIIREIIYQKLNFKERNKYHNLAAEFYYNIKDEFSIRESMNHYLKAKNFNKVSELLDEYGEKLVKKGYCENLNTILEELKDNDIPNKYLAKILLIKGKIKTLIGEWEDALTIFMKCIDVETKASKIQSEAYQGIGYIWTERGKWDKALEYYGNSLKISEILGDKKGLSKVYRLLGNIYWKKSEYGESIKHLDNSLKIANKIGDKTEIGKTYIDLGIIQNEKNKYEKAEKYLEKSLELLKNSDCFLELSRALNSKGISCYAQKNYKKAIEQFEKSIENCKKTGNIKTIGYGLLNLCGCYIEINDITKANEYCNQALTIFEKLKNKRMIASSFLELGKIYRLQKEYDKSMEHFMKSLEISEHLNLPYFIVKNYYEIGLLNKDMENENNAVKFFKKGLQIAKDKKISVYIERINKQIQKS